MNSLVTQNQDGSLVTTSLAVAEGVGNPHSSVIKLIRQNMNDLNEFGPLRFEIQVGNRPQGGGSNTEYAILNEHQATMLITFMRNIGVVKEFKKRLVKAFFEMRDELNKRPPQATGELSRMDILKIAMQSEEERLRLKNEKLILENKIQTDAPRVAFAKQVEIAPDAISVAQAAKILGTGRDRLFAFLRKSGWITRRNEPYQVKIEAGYLDIKLGEWTHPEAGLQKSVTTLVTGKGIAKLKILMDLDGIPTPP